MFQLSKKQEFPLLLCGSQSQNLKKGGVESHVKTWETSSLNSLELQLGFSLNDQITYGRDCKQDECCACVEGTF